MRRQFLKDREDDGEGKENAENESSSSQSSTKKEEKQKRGMPPLPRIFQLNDDVACVHAQLPILLLFCGCHEQHRATYSVLFMTLKATSKTSKQQKWQGTTLH